MKIRFHKIGADPELLVVRVSQDNEIQVIPAYQVLCERGRRNAEASAFIGTDGHPETGELRPPPSKSILGLLYTTGSALRTLNTHIREISGEYSLVARPFVENEPLGGHIHLSLLVEDELLRSLTYSYNVLPRSVTLLAGSYNDELGNNHIPTSLASLFKEKAHSLPLPLSVSSALDFLIKPFEYWVQPWFSRNRRNRRYGAETDDNIRTVYHSSDNWPRFRSMNPELSTYLHYEYRLPSTWLAHPLLAYVYLAFSKLTVLNLRWFLDNKTEDEYMHSPDDAIRALDKRLKVVLDASLRTTGDMRRLVTALDWLRKNRVTLWQKPAVNMPDWEELLVDNQIPIVSDAYNDDDPEFDSDRLEPRVHRANDRRRYITADDDDGYDDNDGEPVL